MGTPGLVIWGLGCSQNFNKALAQRARRQVVCFGKMPVEGGGIELRQDVDLVDSRVDAVAHWHINQTVCPSDGHGWFCAAFGQGI
jgi:hypothetical protein